MLAFTVDEFELFLGKKSFPKMSNLPVLSDDFSLEEQVPTLFRGCHLQELHLELSQIQGRPEDKSYSGGVLHLTSLCKRAFDYEVTNSKREQFQDKRTCVVAYDTKILLRNGEFEPDIVDSDAKTPLESLQKCSQIRWYERPKGSRINAIKFINYQGKVYFKEQIDALIDKYDTKEVIEPSYWVINNLVTKKDRYIKADMSKSGNVYLQELDPPYGYRIQNTLVFDSSKHQYLSFYGYTYKAIGEFTISKCEPFDGTELQGAPISMLSHVLSWLEMTSLEGCSSQVPLEDCGTDSFKYHTLIEPVYPILYS